MESSKFIGVKEDEDEEQLHARQQRRTSPCHPSTTEFVPSLSPPREETLNSPSLSLEHVVTEDGNGVEAIPETPVATFFVGSPAGPSCLRLNFVMPEDEAGLAALCEEIEAGSPPLCNLPFTNRYLST